MILALDSSGDQLVVALLEGGLLRAGATRDGGRHQGAIIETVEEVIGSSGGLGAMDALAVVVGPGSYTGLRVGMSTAAGYAFARRLPIYPLASLLVAAHRATTDQPVTALVEAGRGRAYAQLHVMSGAGWVPGEARRLLAIGDLDAGPSDGLPPAVAEPRLLDAAAAQGASVIDAVRTGPEALAAAARQAIGSGHPLGYDQLAGEYGDQ